MRILIDTDVLLDVALERLEFFEKSASVISWAETNPGQAAVAWHSISNLNYLIRPGSRPFLRDLLEFVEVPATGTADMKVALSSRMPDLEDAMQTAAALAFRADYIVTRNLDDYRHSAVRAISPGEFLKLLS